MKRSRFTEEQIIGVLREQEAGAKTTERRFVIESCLAVACAVALAANLVEWPALDHGQW